MKTLQVKEYNRLDMIRWHERVETWKKENTNNIIPQIAMVGFRKLNGEMRETGYVAFSDHHAYYAKTKREAEKKWVDGNIPL